MFKKVVRYVGFRNVKILRIVKHVLELKMCKHNHYSYKY